MLKTMCACASILMMASCTSIRHPYDSANATGLGDRHATPLFLEQLTFGSLMSYVQFASQKHEGAEDYDSFIASVAAIEIERINRGVKVAIGDIVFLYGMPDIHKNTDDNEDILIYYADRQDAGRVFFVFADEQLSRVMFEGAKHAEQ